MGSATIIAVMRRAAGLYFAGSWPSGMLCKLSVPEPVVPGRAERWDTAKVFREVGEMAGLAGAGGGSRKLLGGLVGEDLEGLKGLGVALLER